MDHDAQELSLISVVGVIELTDGPDRSASTYRPLELHAAAGFRFISASTSRSRPSGGLEARLSWGRRYEPRSALLRDALLGRSCAGTAVTILGGLRDLGLRSASDRARRSGPAVDRAPMVPVEIIAARPSLLIGVFRFYYGGPFIGLSLDNLPAGILPSRFYAAAYYSELWRAGFERRSPGHVEAAFDSLGFSPPRPSAHHSARDGDTVFQARHGQHDHPSFHAPRKPLSCQWHFVPS